MKPAASGDVVLLFLFFIANSRFIQRSYSNLPADIVFYASDEIDLCVYESIWFPDT